MKHCIVLLALIMFCSQAMAQQEVEVLHWWTSGSEAKSVSILKQMMEKQGVHWKNFAVAGGGGETAMTVLKSRAISGNPPAAAQIKGPSLQEWASLGFLANLDPVAKTQHWDQLLPKIISQMMKYHDHYVAVPVNIHRTNWLWINPKLFKIAGVKIPTTWPEFFHAAKKIKAAGYDVLAQGNQNWQNTNLFESIALSVLGSQDYLRAFVQKDPNILTSKKMIRTFQLFKQLHQYIVTPPNSDAWNQATKQVMQGKAAMQITGDWANGEFLLAGKHPGKDFICTPVPGTKNEFIYSIDSFAMFQLSKSDDIKAQQTLAHTIMSAKFQRLFNLTKGSIPARTELNMRGFDNCAKQSMFIFQQSLKRHQLVPSIANGMATTSYVESAIVDVVNHFFNTPDANPKLAVLKLMRAIQAAS
ncbi:MAG: putative sugar-binding periplasmic protein [Candidatus Celerinatantimonas neptuna]|nr:MAG: putative sugar-binding periplasmic protein [Candidatus Celerinatantimonas neptuna]